MNRIRMMPAAILASALLGLSAASSGEASENTFYCDCGSSCSCDESTSFIGSSANFSLYCGSEDAPRTPADADYAGGNVECSQRRRRGDTAYEYRCFPQPPSVFPNTRYSVTFTTECGG